MSICIADVLLDANNTNETNAYYASNNIILRLNVWLTSTSYIIAILSSDFRVQLMIFELASLSCSSPKTRVSVLEFFRFLVYKLKYVCISGLAAAILDFQLLLTPDGIRNNTIEFLVPQIIKMFIACTKDRLCEAES
jgi:hypothetical protein